MLPENHNYWYTNYRGNVLIFIVFSLDDVFFGKLIFLFRFEISIENAITRFSLS